MNIDMFNIVNIKRKNASVSASFDINFLNLMCLFPQVLLGCLGTLVRCDKPIGQPPRGVQPHNFLGAGGFDAFGKEVAPQHAYTGPKFDQGPIQPAGGYGAHGFVSHAFGGGQGGYGGHHGGFGGGHHVGGYGGHHGFKKPGGYGGFTHQYAKLAPSHVVYLEGDGKKEGKGKGKGGLFGGGKGKGKGKGSDYDDYHYDDYHYDYYDDGGKGKGGKGGKGKGKGFFKGWGKGFCEYIC